MRIQKEEDARYKVDVFVYGATPGGIGAALGAARRGRRTLLAEPTGHFGGLMTSGLGRTDILSLEASGAVFREFAGKVYRYYADTYGEDSEQAKACNQGLFFEPSVAHRVLTEMVEQEPLLEIIMQWELEAVEWEAEEQAAAEAGVVESCSAESDAVKQKAKEPKPDMEPETLEANEAGPGTINRAEQASTAASAVKLTGVLLRRRADEGSGGHFVADMAESLERTARKTVRAGMFIDATYEGDLAAMAGVPWHSGRESRDEWNEEYAGKLYMDFAASKEVFSGSTGEGDERIQAYNFRLCLTQRPEIRIPFRKPESYCREDYASLAGDVAVGRVRSIRDVMNMLPVPNGKTDCNNHHYCMCSTDLPEENQEYADGDAAVRAAFVQRQRDYIQGLLWFLQNDEALPAEFREEALTWGYAGDEFAEHGHFPPQIYVREARRIEGEYTFTENDARVAPGLERAPVHPESIAIGDYPIDSHATRKREAAGRDRALEGFLGLGWLTKVYQIPYGVIVPKRVDGLLVPVAVSATHMGFGTIRMEPCWMQLGFAAGVAGDLCLAEGTTPRKLPVDALQLELLAANQRITYFADIPWGHPARAAAEYFGTKGLFTSYEARLDDPLQAAEASRWIAAARLLPGGRALPSLPATDRLLPAGADMGPRQPREEPQPEEQWRERPHLPSWLAGRWHRAACRALGAGDDAGGWATTLGDERRPVTRGEFCALLYSLLAGQRQQASAASSGVNAAAIAQPAWERTGL